MKIFLIKQSITDIIKKKLYQRIIIKKLLYETLLTKNDEKKLISPKKNFLS